MNIGILGGTFDPIHNGHLRLAELAYEQFGLDEVWLVPAPVPPFKPHSCVASYEDRLHMTRLATEGRLGLICSDYEAHLYKGERSYTSDTVSTLKAERPDDHFSLILGSDSFHTIETWHRPDVIFANASIIVAIRRDDSEHPTLQQAKEHLQAKYGADIGFIDSEEYDVSSTDIRRRLAAGESIEGLVPESVREYILQRGLYVLTGRG